MFDVRQLSGSVLEDESADLDDHSVDRGREANTDHSGVFGEKGRIDGLVRGLVHEWDEDNAKHNEAER